MRRIWTGTAAAAALATAFATSVAFAQETQQGKQPPQGMESGQHRETGQGQMRAAQPGARAETDQPRMGAEPTQGQNTREREQPGKPAMKGESAQTQEPANRAQPGKMVRGPKAGSQERRAEQTGPASGQPGAGAQNRQDAAQTGETGKQMTGRNVQATGKTNLPHDKAARVAQTLMAGGAARNSQNVNVDVSVGAALPAQVVVNPLPITIVDLVPEFRGYDYFVMGDEIVIVDPVTRRVVEIIEDVG
jgi:hypothetical protein